MVRILGVGECALDHLLVLPEVRVSPIHLVGEAYRCQGGGPAANAMVAVSRLGAKAELWGRVGDDFSGRRILEELKAEKVDVSQVQVVKGATSCVALILIDQATGERHVHAYLGGGLEKAGVGKIDVGRIRKADAVLVDDWWEHATLRAALEAKKHTVPVIGDLTEITPANEELVAHLDVIVVTRACAERLVGGAFYDKALLELRARGPKVAVITLGEQGCGLSDGATSHWQNAFRVKVVDTTGAGSAFRGAFAFGYAHGWPLPRIAEFACAVAGLACQDLGARTSLPVLKEVNRLLEARDREADYLDPLL
jgi:sulfofructose kinase